MYLSRWGRFEAVQSVKIQLPPGLISPLNRVSLVAFRRGAVGWRGNSTYAASCGSASVQGPEICFPKHASCDFSQHCRAQHSACCFLEISCEKRTNPEPLPLSSHLAPSLSLPLRLFYFFLGGGGFLRPDYVALRSMTKDFIFFLGCWTFILAIAFCTPMPKR